MNFELQTLPLSRFAAQPCDALVLLVPSVPAKTPSGRDALAQLLEQATQSGDFEAKPGKLLQAYRPAGLAAKRVVLVGVGADPSPAVARKAVVAALETLKESNTKHVLLALSALPEVGAPLLQAVVLAASEATYVYSLTKSTTKAKAKNSATIERVVLGVLSAPALQASLTQAQALAQGIALAREWGNRPPNHATPRLLAGAAKELGKFKRTKVEVLGPKEVAKLGMGAFMAVARGSEEPLRFVVLRYEGAPKTQAPIVLVGKGITFDSGGISIKPAAEMDEMKFDMCGAASVLGTFHALGQLQPALNVVGLIPTCENLPDGRAVKPGDVVTSMSGQTIEILNTDAEGRLILCDALTYAERFKPRAVVDIATLTGACVVALGGVRSGLFSSDDALAQALLDAGEKSLDLCWRMPLDDAYAEGLKSRFADVANVAGRAGGSVTAAKFLQRFTKAFAWAHLDIAGTAWKSGLAKGATGRPVALLLAYLLGQVNRAEPPATASAAANKPKTATSTTPSNATKKIASSSIKTRLAAGKTIEKTIENPAKKLAKKSV